MTPPSLAPIKPVVDAVCEVFGVDGVQLAGKARPAGVVIPRHAAMMLAHEMMNFTCAEIGSAFGGRDHTSVTHARFNVSNLRETDPTFERQFKLARSLAHSYIYDPPPIDYSI